MFGLFGMKRVSDQSLTWGDLSRFKLPAEQALPVLQRYPAFAVTTPA